jgi:hypothetical protein
MRGNLYKVGPLDCYQGEAAQLPQSYEKTQKLTRWLTFIRQQECKRLKISESPENKNEHSYIHSQ